MMNAKAKRPRELDFAGPASKLRRCDPKQDGKKYKDAAKELVEAKAKTARILLEVLQEAYKLSRETHSRLMLDITSRREALDAGPVLEILAACGFKRQDENIFHLDFSPKNRVVSHNIIQILSKELGAGKESSSSMEKTGRLVTVVEGVAETKLGNPLSCDQKSFEDSHGLKNAIQLILENKEQRVIRGTLRAFLQILKVILKKPSDIRHRRLLRSSVVSRKFITTPKGGSDLARSCGFRVENCKIGSKLQECYFMEKADTARISVARRLIEGALNDLSGKKAVPSSPKKRVKCSCGYWGSSDTGGLCSVCFKKKTFGVANTKKPSIPAKAKPKARWRSSLARARVKLKAVRRFKLGMKSVRIQQNKSRCFQCNKKVGILGFECKCMFVFCDKHRFPDAHNCKFDYKRHHRNKLKKDNQALSRWVG
eukprot:1314703-Amorphochlora_amoeboformis.AAC.2